MALVHFGAVPFDAGAILFDKDGTLIDFHTLWARKCVAGVDRLLAAAREVEGSLVGPAGDGAGDAPTLRAALFRALGYDEARGRFDAQGPVVTAPMQTLYTIGATVLYQHGFRWLDALLLADRHMAQGMADTFEASMIRPLSDVGALFDALRRAGVRIGVITSDDEAPTWRTLEILGVSHAVEFLAGADGGHAHKPAPDAVLAACAHFAIEPAQAVVVGDSTTDLLMGRRARVGLNVGVTSGLMAADVLERTADVILGSIDEIHLA